MTDETMTNNIYNKQIKELGLTAFLGIQPSMNQRYWFYDIESLFSSDNSLDKITLTSSNHSINNVFLKIIKEKHQRVHYKYVSFNEYTHKYSSAVKKIRESVLNLHAFKNIYGYFNGYEINEYEESYSNKKDIPFYQQKNQRSQLHQHAQSAKSNFKKRR